MLHVYEDGSVSGRDTLFDSIAAASGARNVAHDRVKGWQKLSAEALMSLDPGAIVVGVEPSSNLEQEIKRLADVAGIQKLRAWSEKQIIIMPESELSAVSPYIVRAVSKLQSELLKLNRIPQKTKR